MASTTSFTSLHSRREEVSRGCKPKETTSKSDTTIDLSHINRWELTHLD